MHNSQIIIFAAAMAVLAIRLYQKYIKKDKSKSGTDTRSGSDASFSSSTKDDEYEPYSKK